MHANDLLGSNGETIPLQIPPTQLRYHDPQPNNKRDFPNLKLSVQHIQSEPQAPIATNASNTQHQPGSKALCIHRSQITPTYPNYLKTTKENRYFPKCGSYSPRHLPRLSPHINPRTYPKHFMRKIPIINSIIPQPFLPGLMAGSIPDQFPPIYLQHNVPKPNSKRDFPTSKLFSPTPSVRASTSSYISPAYLQRVNATPNTAVCPSADQFSPPIALAFLFPSPKSQPKNL